MTPETDALVLNAFPILNPQHLRWDVRLYEVVPLPLTPDVGHETRGEIKNALWELRKRHRNCCSGLGFIVDVAEDRAAVSSTWDLPDVNGVQGFRVARGDRRVVSAVDGSQLNRKIALGILRESIKLHFKDHGRRFWGSVWQDYNEFCLHPEMGASRTCAFSKKLHILPRYAFEAPCLQTTVSTVAIDTTSFLDHCRHDGANELHDLLRSKLARPATRQGQSQSIRVWHRPPQGSSMAADVWDLHEPEILSRQLSSGAEPPASVLCKKFGRSPTPLPASELHLILDPSLTSTDHRETILSPAERREFALRMREFCDGMQAFGAELRLAASPLTPTSADCVFVPPPAVTVRGPNGPRIIASPTERRPQELRHRARERQIAARRYGFLHSAHLDPLLAWPESHDPAAKDRMVTDLNNLLRRRKINSRFVAAEYSSAASLKTLVAETTVNAILVVLPDEHPSTVHEAIKQEIDIPSQCIVHANTLPAEWAGRPIHELRSGNPGLQHRINERYELCLDNLLTKVGWVPYVPAEPFAYNVQIGIDVGGPGNNRVAACIGYGFADARCRDLGYVFRTQEIPVQAGKSEPIPTESLFDGLRRLLAQVVEDLQSEGIRPDLGTVLIFRDGAMLGQGDAWNEREAFERLVEQFRQVGYVGQKPVWTVAEVLKRGSRWRGWRGLGREIGNPVVGEAVLELDGDSQALVFTTGEPYLSQGTADPPMVRINDIAGKADLPTVVKDFVWAADMGYSKMDLAHGLPWVLHVADTGALQLSRCYRIPGITT